MNNPLKKIRPNLMANRRFFSLFFYGLLLRLSVMPFFAHVDFFSEYRRVFKAAELGRYFAAPTRQVVFLIESFFLKISSFLYPNADKVFYFEGLDKSTAWTRDYFIFVTDPYIFRTLFILKIPYLLFDMGTAVLIYQLLKKHINRDLALKLWLFNPVTLYAFYIFGRFESIPIFFLALTAYFLSQKRLILTAVAFGIAINCREIMIIYLPILGLALIQRPFSIKQIIRDVLPPMAIIGFFFSLPFLVQKGLHIDPLFLGKSALEVSQGQQIFGLQVGWLYTYIFGYALLCCWLLEYAGTAYKRFLMAGSFCIVSMILLCSHSAHYVSWMVLFPILTLQYNRPISRPLILFFMIWIVCWAIRTDRGVFTFFLASPLSVSFYGVIILPDWLRVSYGSHPLLNLPTLINIVRSLYAAALVYLLWQMSSKGKSVSETDTLEKSRCALTTR